MIVKYLLVGSKSEFGNGNNCWHNILPNDDMELSQKHMIVESGSGDGILMTPTRGSNRYAFNLAKSASSCLVGLNSNEP